MAGGLNIIELGVWKSANSMKLLWNLCKKADKLWVKWVHVYYFKKMSVWEYMPGSSCSWVMRAILKEREKVRGLKSWEEASNDNKFPTGKVYRELRGPKDKVEWGKMVCKNKARPRAKFILWMLCKGRLNTKDRVAQMGVNTDMECCFCNKEESLEHLFFECQVPNEMWGKVLAWLQLNRQPLSWSNEMKWLIRVAKSKSARAQIINMAATEMIYMIWQMRNRKVFGGRASDGEEWREVCRIIAVRSAKQPALQSQILKLDGRC